jgi:Zn-dependent peptidase ImmA (M78 family)
VSGAAAATRQWLGLTDENSFEKFRQAIEARGILVFRTNGYAGQWQIEKTNPILGFCLYDTVCPVIVVKKQDATSRQTFTLFHELGHLLLQRASSIDEENDVWAQHGAELAANTFAGEVLVPNAILATINDGQRPANVAGYDAWLTDHKALTGASMDVLLIRLVRAGRLAQNQYDQYVQWRSAQEQPEPPSPPRKYRYREPKHVFGEPFVRAVFEALHERQITLPRASSYLDNLKLVDLKRLESEHVGL